jgi:hypothetical protein
VLEFQQSTIGQIIDSEREMVLTALQRYGKYYETALEGSLLMTRFLKSVDPDRWIFGSFVSLVKKHHTLALFSTVRLQNVQAMMNLRQTLEAEPAQRSRLPIRITHISLTPMNPVLSTLRRRSRKSGTIGSPKTTRKAQPPSKKSKIGLTRTTPMRILSARTARAALTTRQASLSRLFLTSRTSITLKQTYALSRMSPTLC